MDTTKQTTGKEVLNITNPLYHKWHVSGNAKGDEYSTVILGGQYKGIIARTEINVYTDTDTAESNAKAICTAVNESYGKGFRPEAMEELYKALEEITDMALRWSVKGLTPTIHTAQTALNNAKI